MNNVISLPYAIFLPFVVGVFTPYVYRRLGKATCWLVGLVPLSLLVYFLTFIGEAGMGGPIAIWRWVPDFHIDLVFSLSGLSLLMAILITGIGLLVTVYALFYMSEKENLGRFYSYVLFFMGAMLGVVTSDHLMMLYVFWELTSVSSFLLIGFWHENEQSRQGALKALMVTVLGGFALLAAFVLLYLWGGTFSIPELKAHLAVAGHGAYYIPIVLLVFVGTWTKSAQFPFHFWLPGAMAAPTPVSAYLHSATMVKAGIFLTAKLALLLGGTPLWYYGIATIGAITVLVGGWLAVQQTDLKALLAFSTVSQLGLIMPMFAIATPLTSAAGTAHIFNHALFKGALFLLVGIIDVQTGTRDIRRLGSLTKYMPLTGWLMVIAALSMAGVWPFNGFVSKELIFDALLNPPFGNNVWTALLAIITVAGSVLTTIYCLVLAHRIQFTQPASPSTDLYAASAYDSVSDDGGDNGGDDRNGVTWVAGDPGLGMLAGPILLVALVVLTGLFPGWTHRLIVNPAASAVAGVDVALQPPLLPGLNLPFAMSLVALGLGLFGYVHMPRVLGVLGRFKPRLHANMVYDAVFQGVEKVSAWMLRGHMTGFLRDYLVYILIATVGFVGYAFVTSRAWQGFTPDYASADLTEIIVLVLTVAAALYVVTTKKRLVAIAALGVVGILQTVLYVLLRAPDLALTQFMVDAISVVLMLMVFRHLPPFWPEKVKPKKNRIDVIVAVATGVLVTVVAFMANGYRFFPSVSQYYVDNSLSIGGGTNIVNVILVDFRGFDTMGEITVLALAGLSVYALVRLGKGMKRRR